LGGKHGGLNSLTTDLAEKAQGKEEKIRVPRFPRQESMWSERYVGGNRVSAKI